MEDERNDSSIIVKVKLLKNEYTRFIYSLSLKNRSIRFMYLSGLIVAIWLPFIMHKLYDNNSNGTTTMFLSYFVCLFIYFIMFPLSGLRVANKMYAANKFVSEEQRYDITREGFEVDTETMHGKVLWNSVVKAIELKDFVVVCTSITIDKSYVFPKRCFESVDDLNKFKKIIKENVKKSNIK